MSEAAQLFKTGLDCLARSDLDGYLDLFSDDVTFELPFAPPERPDQIRGRENLRHYLEPLLSLGALDKIAYLAIFETNVEGTVIAEMTLNLRPMGSSGVLPRRYIAVVSARGGRIVSYRDYWNPNWAGEHVREREGT